MHPVPAAGRACQRNRDLEDQGGGGGAGGGGVGVGGGRQDGGGGSRGRPSGRRPDNGPSGRWALKVERMMV